MPEIRGMTVCVGDFYAKLLQITLVRNMRHLTECVVVTTPDDEATKAVVAGVPGARCFETTAFHDHGAIFNKGYSMELAYDYIGRSGWFLSWDADILMPDDLALDCLQEDTLHGATRRILAEPGQWYPGYPFSEASATFDQGPVGFFQLFPAEAPSLQGKRPWFEVTYTHAGGGDAYFLRHFPLERQAILPVEVLHLGPRDRNWFGTNPESQAIMARYQAYHQWIPVGEAVPRPPVDSPGIAERVHVPGYERTGFELSFTRQGRGAGR